MKDLNESRLACLRFAGDDVERPRPKRELPNPAIVAVEYDVGDLHHGFTPKVTKIVVRELVRANQRPTKRAFRWISATSEDHDGL
jgi:hypothetical protein